jgi:hypothetical protein
VEGRDEAPDEAPWTRQAEDEDPEPDWAERIRSGRKARGSTLRERYAKFADEPTPLDDEPTQPHDEPTPPDDEADPE